MSARFRVATRATGHRRQVWVHVYDDRDELCRQHAKDRHHPYDPDVHGGVVSRGDYHWPEPDPGPVVIMRLWTGQLTTKTVAHESVHAAAMFVFMDVMKGWNSRARPLLLDNNEELAYAVGDIASETIRNLYRLRLLPQETP